MIRNKYDLHLFDGESGGAVGASVPGNATGIASQSYGENQKPQVVYGKDVDPQDTSSQVGSDEGAASAPDAQDPGEDLDAEFDELIKGKYKKQFGDRMQAGIQNRFKNATDYEGQVNQYAEAVGPLMAMYGLEPDNIEGLKNAIESDDSLYQTRADKEGLTTERFRENLRLMMEARIGQNLRQRIEQEQSRAQMFAEWDADAAQLKEAFPNFDLEQELQNNQAFAESLERGNSVRESFFLAHMDEILSGSNEQSAEQATHNAINAIRQRAARPSENGLARQPAIVRKADPSKFTKEDLMEVARRARNGETIRF